MKTILLTILLGFAGLSIQAQLYFPSIYSDDWEAISPADMGWCQTQIDSLYDFLEEKNTKAFIVLKDGKIVLERYFDDHTVDSFWYWASAGKTLTAFMVGIAQQENLLSINDTTSNYLGAGWTSCTAGQEEKITIRHQLSMTTGLDDGVADPYCTDASCLQYKADAGTRWAYHNGSYTLLTDVVENATGKGMNNYVAQKLKSLTGMDGLYVEQDDNQVFFSTARSMARFGLLVLNRGTWNETPIMTDRDYFDAMTTPSQSLNESYGYLWWLNGQSSFMVPQSQLVLPGSLCPNAPDDMIAALGKNGQFINVVPSENMVWIRMGEAPDNSLVSYTLNDEIWSHMNKLTCHPVSVTHPVAVPDIQLFPNPANDFITVALASTADLKQVRLTVVNPQGQVVDRIDPQNHQVRIAIHDYPSGIYFLSIQNQGKRTTLEFIKQ